MIRIKGLTYNPQKVSYTRVLGDEREVGEIVVKTNQKRRFHKWDIVEIDNNYQYCVDTDQVVGLGGGLYEHTVILTELLDRFESIDVTSRGVYPSADGLESVKNVLDKYKRELEFYKNVFIDYIDGDWQDVKTVQMEFDGMTFKQVLTRLFRVLGATPKAIYEDGTWLIYPQKWSFRNNLINPKKDAYYQEADSIAYATKIKAQVKNAVYDNIQPNWFPSRNGYILPRGETISRAESELEYKLDSEIVGILKVEVVDVFVGIGYNGEDITVTYDSLDITDNVVVQEEYDSLKVTDDEIEEITEVNKNNHIIFDIEGTRLFNLWNKEGIRGWFRETPAENLKNAISYQVYKQHFPEEDITYIVVGEHLRDIKLRVQYVRKRDLDILINKHFSDNMNIATEMYNQTSSIVELSQLKNNIANITNRSGTDKEVYTRTYDKNQEMDDIGDYTANGQVITKAKFTPQKNYVFAEYELNRNVAPIDEEYQFKRELNPFTITTKKLTTNVIQEVFMISSETKGGEETVLSNKGRRSLLNILDDNTEGAKKAEFAMYQADPTNYGSDERIHMPIESGGGARSISLHASFMKNIVAGYEIAELNGDRIQQPIIYKYEQIGTPQFSLPDFKLYIGQGIDIEDNGKYPIVEETEDIINSGLTLDESKPIDLGKNDALAYTLMIHTMSDTNDIIVGNAFAEYNHIVRDPQFNNLRLYVSEVPYSIMDDQPRPNDTHDQEGFYFFNYVDRKLEVTTESDYWAIVKELDGVDRILIAGNKVDEIYFNFHIIDKTASAITIQFYPINVSDSVVMNEHIELGIKLNYGLNVNDSVITNESIELGTILRYGLNVNDSVTTNQSIELGTVLKYGINVNDSVSTNEHIELSTVLRYGLSVNDSVSTNEYIELEYEAPPTPREWVLTTDTNNDISSTYTVDGELDPCPTSSYINDWLTDRRDPMGQDFGTICRVVVNHENAEVDCDDYYYKIEEI